MQWLLIGYMFLFIHRPFEVWPSLDGMHLERVYIGAVTLYWCIYPNKRWLPNSQHYSYLFFGAAVLVCWVLSPWMDTGQTTVENWFKIIVYYLLFVTVAHDEKMLKQFTYGFLFVMGLYMTHSLKEFIGGRHTYRMSIVRMIGVDTSLGDPNSFGASIVFALPFVTCVWKTTRSRFIRFCAINYVCLSCGCILLTGSRSSLIGMLVWWSILLWRSKHRWLGFSLATALAPVVFLALPESLQTRFETIINPDVGPENAKTSGEGRLEGLENGLKLWSNNPLTGIGPGAWRPATGSPIESHNLYGQLMGEMGTLGIIAFVSILFCFKSNLAWMARYRRRYREQAGQFPFQLCDSIAVSLFMLLLMGNFGHNLFRHNWLWYGGYVIVARYCVEMQHKAALKSIYSARVTWQTGQSSSMRELRRS